MIILESESNFTLVELPQTFTLTKSQLETIRVQQRPHMLSHEYLAITIESLASENSYTAVCTNGACELKWYLKEGLFIDLLGSIVLKSNSRNAMEVIADEVLNIQLASTQLKVINLTLNICIF